MPTVYITARNVAAKELYNTLTKKRTELFIVGWQNDPQPKERVKGEIVYILNKFLPDVNVNEKVSHALMNF